MPDLKAALIAVRDQRPLVHNITNYVAMDLSANALLALGAAPAMIHAEQEAADFAAISSALVVNIGTLSPPWVRAMKAASERASCPVVLDPVGAGATTWRTSVAVELVHQKPALIRGNASEILALDGASGTTRGVDATDAVDTAHDAAVRLAKITGGLVAVTGEVDLVTDGERTIRVHGGDELMTRVTAIGCALSASCGAFLAAVDDPMCAVSAALATFKRAGQLAAQRSTDPSFGRWPTQGPGSFRVTFLDTLFVLEPSELDEVRLS